MCVCPMHKDLIAIDVFSKFTFDYPYPVAISVNGPVFGMEYPMICFNGPRPEKDGTYSESTKNALIGVVIHEVGHNWFPMIVNSDGPRVPGSFGPRVLGSLGLGFLVMGHGDQNRS